MYKASIHPVETPRLVPTFFGLLRQSWSDEAKLVRWYLDPYVIINMYITVQTLCILPLKKNSWLSSVMFIVYRVHMCIYIHTCVYIYIYILYVYRYIHGRKVIVEFEHPLHHSVSSQSPISQYHSAPDRISKKSWENLGNVPLGRPPVTR